MLSRRSMQIVPIPIRKSRLLSPREHHVTVPTGLEGRYVVPNNWANQQQESDAPALTILPGAPSNTSLIG